MEVTEDEIKILNMRRNEEIKEFEKMHKILPSPKEKSKFYCVEMEWYLQWKAFVLNDQSEKNITKNKLRISQNKDIGE